MPDWQTIFARRSAQLKPSAIRQTAVYAAQPGAISFASGSPNPELFPHQAVIDAVQAIVADPVLRGQALQYGASEGYAPLRALIAEMTTKAGGKIEAANVLIVNGSQQALEFTGTLLIEPGDRVIVTAPTFLGGLQAFGLGEPCYVSVAVDDSGIDLAALEREFSRGAKFFYVMPDFGNPSGVTLSLEHRRRILTLARQYAVPILEDQAYAELHFGPERLPSLLELDSAEGEPTTVIHTSTFSKSIAPGLRVGWIIAPKAVVEKLVFIKQASDLQGPLLNQMIVHRIASGDFAEQIAQLQTAYRRRRDQVLSALAHHMPQEVRWNEPDGGMFVWVELPKPLDAAQVQERGVHAEKVVIVPGAPFFANGGGENTLRISFALAPEHQINEGIARLARAIRWCMAAQDGARVG